MNRHLFSFIALFLVAQMMWAASVTPAASIPSYYSALDGKASASLWSAVSSAAAKSRSSLGYDGLYNAYKQTDTYPTSSTHPEYVAGKAGQVWDMYSNCDYSHGSKKCGSYSGECDCYNREHSIPQSWWGGGTSGIGCDIFHVLPTDGYVNNRRGNLPFGEVSSASYTSHNGSKVGGGKGIVNSQKTIAASSGTTTSAPGGNVFEPINQYKGDLARGIMGTMASWNRDLTSSEGSKFFKSSYTVATNFGLTPYGVALLMKWHRQDPVSQKEIDRNNGIQATQGNRNPFIDYPYLAEYIWGERAGETVDMENLIPSTDNDFIPGKSNGWRGGSTPVDPTPTPVTIKYGITFMVNGQELRTDSVVENAQPTSLPATPTSCSAESNIFVGWTTTPISGTSDIAPKVLYTQAKQIPALKDDLTLYATFAKKQTTQTGQVAATEKLDFSTGYSNGQDVTGKTQGGVTVAFSQASGNNPPKYYNSGNAVRCYANNTITVTASDITKIAFTFGSSDNSNAITANKGSFSTNTWTGTADEVVFTIGGTSGHRRIAAVEVTMNGVGETTVYSRYITSCQTTTELTEHPMDMRSARKVLIGGQIYLQVADGLYNMLGQKINGK